MAIEPGHTLLHYRIVEKIGEGGMGEVWKARDTHLDRDVAVKILPDSVANDPDRLARFEREAKAVAALTHPNILAVYDFGREGDTTYMVTELLEGDTLRDRLGEGALPQRKAAELARQVARGLAAAHDKGFVHRDLKPDNVFITNEGRAKILDFGLALLSMRDAETAQPPDTPTRTELTTPGAVVGTADYMSPEQVRGEKVDHRSDIFSFGTVLSEMLTGRQPFHHDTMAETMTAVLRADPPSGSTDTGEIPPALDRVVRRCLEKRPEERFQSASDLAFAVENALGTSSGSAVVQGIDVTEDVAPRRVGMAITLVAVFVAMIAGALVGRISAPEAPVPPTYAQVTFRQGRVTAARFATDGQSIVYSADWEGEGLRLFTVHPQTPESRSLDVDDAEILSVSSKGDMALLLRPRYIVGFTRRGTLARMPLGGGAPRELLESIASADWNPAGDELAIARIAGSVSRLEYPPGNILHETAGWISGVRFSRDGEHIAFADHPHIGDNRGYAAVTDLAGNARRLGEIWSSLAGVGWSPDGSEIWFTAGRAGTSRALQAIDLNGTHYTRSRGPVDLVLYDIDADGRALISRTNLSRGIVGKPPGSDEEVTLTWLDWSFLDVLSLDGETVLFTEQGEGGGAGYSSILRSTRGGPAIRMGPGQAMAISPDGTRVMTRLLDGDNPLMIYPTGAGEVETLDTGNVLVSFADWTTDPDRLFVTGVREGTGFRGYLFEPRSGEMEPVITEDLDFISIAYHRDLGLVAARTVDGPLQIFPLDGSEPRAVAVPDPGLAPLGWSRDGRALFVGEYGKVPLVVSRLDLDTGEMKTMWELMPSELAGLIDVGPVLVNPDGTAYAYSYRRDLSILYRADGF